MIKIFGKNYYLITILLEEYILSKKLILKWLLSIIQQI